MALPKILKLVVIESPYGARWFWQRWRNRRYARACVRDSLMRGESPIASHLLYTQRGILRDGVAEERELGIEAGLSWVANATAVYTDLGISAGMKRGIAAAEARGIPVEMRSLKAP